MPETMLGVFYDQNAVQMMKNDERSKENTKAGIVPFWPMKCSPIKKMKRSGEKLPRELSTGMEI